MAQHPRSTSFNSPATAGLLALALTTLATAPAQAQTAFGVGSGPIAEIFETNCVSCHMKDGSGGPGGTPSLLKDIYRHPQGAAYDREFFDVIKLGKKDDDGNPTPMTGFGDRLKDNQIWALVVYVRELQDREYDKRVTEPGKKGAAQNGIYKSKHHAYKIETVVEDGLETPWSVDWLPTGEMLITERDGRLRVWSKTGDSQGSLSAAVEGVPEVFARGQGGLMDVALHPDYAVKGAAGEGLIYLSLSQSNGENRRVATTGIIVGKLTKTGDKWAFTDKKDIFRAPNNALATGSAHFGSRIVFGPLLTEGEDKGKRHLYFSIGDRGNNPAEEYKQVAQRVDNPSGKVHRLFDDGTIPSDNPFFKEAPAGDEGRVQRGVWSLGHRNIQGLAFDANGRLFATEHGPRGGDELNLIEKGRNYGWPVVSHSMNYNGQPLGVAFPDVKGEQAVKLNIKQPIMPFMPSIGACGLDVVRNPGKAGTKWFNEWEGDVLAGGLSGQNVTRIRVNDKGEAIEREDVLLGHGRVRDVVAGPDGAIYVVLNGPDQVIRLMAQ
jgi:aldose sugar dehydrogenase